jgi:hypothetical protein
MPFTYLFLIEVEIVLDGKPGEKVLPNIIEMAKKPLWSIFWNMRKGD